MLSAFVLVLGLCPATSVMAQTARDLANFQGGTPPENAAALSIGTLCPKLPNASTLTGARQDLKLRCNEMVANGGQNSLTPLHQVSSDKIPTQGNTKVETGGAHLGNVSTRLGALRGGATGLSVQGLALNMNGKTLPGSMLAGLFPGTEGREVTTADAPTIFPKFETSSGVNASPGRLLANLLAQSKSDGTGDARTPSPWGRLGAFATGNFSWGDRDTTSQEWGFDFDTQGTTAGIDYRFTDNFILGTAFGFTSTDADLAFAGGTLDTNQYSGSLYSTYYFDRWYVDGILTIGWNTFDSKRNIVYSIPGTGTTAGTTTQVNQTATGDTDGLNYSLGAGGGYEFRHGGFSFGPYGRLNYFKLDINGYGETINSTSPGFGWSLAFNDQTVESLTTALGGQVIYALSTKFAVLVPQLLFEWVHEFLDDGRLIAGHYINDPTQQPLNIRTDGLDDNYFNLGVGLSAVFPRGMSAFVYYQAALALEHITKNDIVLGVRLAF
jgi:uncharacterized protein YhjY with autotransporter beta-barrel domain